MKFLTAPLIDPASAETYYGSGTTHTSSFAGVSGFEGYPPEIVETARALKGDPDLIYEFVHNQIEVEFGFGAAKGPLGALIDRSATPFDQNELYVALARASGLTARYRIGRVTIAAADFTAWTGVSDIQAACRLLANGGIPAAFNGAASSPSDCSGTGTFTSVTLLHAWSEVQIGGTWYAYDPSFKAHTAPGAFNLTSLAGLTTGAASSAAASGSDTGTASGSNYLHNVSTSGLNTFLQARGVQLLSALKSSAPAIDTDTVVGLGKIIPLFDPVGGWRNATPAGYTASADTTITGDMPDQYRTSLQVSLASGLARNVYGDEVYGRRLQLNSNWENNVDYSTPQVTFEVDDVALATETGSQVCGGNSYCSIIGIGDYLTLAVNHPYAANGGTYADQSVTKLALLTEPVTIVFGLGQTSQALETKWSAEHAQDKVAPPFAPPFPCTPSASCTPDYASAEGDFTRSKLAAGWMAQTSRMVRLQAAVGGAVQEVHHTLGMVSARYDVVAAADSQSPGSPAHYGINEQYLEVNVDTALSLTSLTNDFNKVKAISRAVAVASATLEGSLIEQTQDLPDAASTASRFAWANAGDEAPCGITQLFYDFTGSTTSSRASLLTYEASASGCNAPTHPISLAPPSDWEARLDAAISIYLAAGFKVIAPGESFLGPGSRVGSQISWASTPPAPPSGTNNWDPSRQRGAAVIATRSDASGAVVEVAHALSNIDGGIAKGGGATQPQFSASYDPQKAPEQLKDRFVDKSVALGVDLKTGAAGYTTPTLISAGAGSTPYKLDFKLSYKNAPSSCNAFGPCVTTQGGWNHNWDLRFNLGGSGMEAMGSTSPFAAAGTLAAFLALQDIYGDTTQTDLTKDVYGALAADWWRQQMIGNTATAGEGGGAQQYIREVDGTWFAPIGSAATLAQSGVRAKVRDLCISTPDTPPGSKTTSTSRRWGTTGVSFSVRNRSGDTLAITPWKWVYSEYNSCEALYGFQVNSWTWPQGVSLTFAHQPWGEVTGVTSSFGRTLTITKSDGVTGPLIAAAIGSAQATQTGDGAIHNAAGETLTFDFTPVLARSATQRPIVYNQIAHVFEPVTPSQAALEYVYDSRGLVKTARDATAIQQGSRGPYVWYIAEGGRGEHDDPLGGAYVVNYDTDGNAVRYINELGHPYLATYDGRHRVTSRTNPAGDQTQFAYDALDNTITLTKLPKPGTPLSPIVIHASYDPTFNKLAEVIDGLGNATDLTYVASGSGASLLSAVQRPAVGGTRPTYTYAYNAIGLPTQEVDPTGVTTTHTYSATGDLTSTTRAAAAVGTNPALNLTTTFTPDTVGNVTAVVDPRGNSVTSQFDVMHRTTAMQERNGGVSALPLAAKQYTYDPNGRQLTEQKASAIDGSGNVTSWQVWSTSYTPTGKVASKTDPLGHVTATTYTALDLPYQVTDPTNRITQSNYDVAGNVIAELRAVGTPLQQTYATYNINANGLVNQVTDARGNLTTTPFDGFNRKAQTTFPDGTTEVYTYDANDNMVTWQNRGGFQIQRTYDVLNRKTAEQGVTNGAANTSTRWWDMSNATFSYDLAGRGTAAANGNWVNNWTYDAAGRTSQLIGSAGTFTYAYDASGNVTGVTYPNSAQVGYAYDPLNRMSSATLGATSVATLAYDVLNRRLSTTFGDGSSTGYGYDAADRLISQSQVFPNGSAANVTDTFGYDNAGRLTSNATTNAGYQYTPPNASVSYAAADSMNRYSTVGGVPTTYWAEGEINNDGRLNYIYDEGGNFREAYDSASNSDSTSHDALGQTIARGTVQSGGTDILQYYVIGERPEVMFDRTYTSPNGQNAWVNPLDRNYVLGPNPDERLAYQDSNGTIYYPHADRQGTTVAIATAGQDVLTRTYGPYGEIQQPVTRGPGASAYPYLYTGQFYANYLGLYDYKARLYDPKNGRFYQSDPIGTKDDLNLYQYTNNSPLDGDDPTGEACDAGIGSATRIGGEGGSSCGASTSSLSEAKEQEKKTASAIKASDAGLCGGNGGCERAVYDHGYQQADHDFKPVGQVALIGIGAAVALPVALDAIPYIAQEAAGAVRSLGRCCFAAGTLVDTDRGLRPIELIAIGERVNSRDPITGKTAFKAVTGLVHRHNREIYLVKLDVFSPSEGEHIASFETTDDHPWRSVSGAWLHTVELKPDVFLQRADGQPARVVSVVDSGKTAATFNLEIADFHTYFVGEDRIWVHNACPEVEPPFKRPNTTLQDRTTETVGVPDRPIRQLPPPESTRRGSIVSGVIDLLSTLARIAGN